MEHTSGGPHEVSITADGVRYEGSYIVQDGVVTVNSPWGSDTGKVAPAGLAQTAARILLHDIIRAQLGRRSRHGD